MCADLLFRTRGQCCSGGVWGVPWIDLWSCQCLLCRRCDGSDFLSFCRRAVRRTERCGCHRPVRWWSGRVFFGHSLVVLLGAFLGTRRSDRNAGGCSNGRNAGGFRIATRHLASGFLGLDHHVPWFLWLSIACRRVARLCCV